MEARSSIDSLIFLTPNNVSSSAVRLQLNRKALAVSAEYLGESQDGNTTLRVDFWLEESKTKEKFKVTFYLEEVLLRHPSELRM